jgi:deoxyribonuclease-2
MPISTLDENGSPVDWWFIYKVPKLTQDASNDAATGYEYVYFDAGSDSVRKSPYRLDQGKGALNLTLASVFTDPAPTVGWILYNDEKPPVAPGPDDGNLGHTKGVIAFDTKSDSAFWLLHSWPKYAAPGLPAMPTPIYGQTFLCVTLDLATANTIAGRMPTHQEPQCYLPRAANLTPTNGLYALTQPVKPSPPAAADAINYKSKGGMPFKVFAKNRAWDGDFWNGLVGPTLGADMDDETWIRGPIPPVVDTDGIHKTFDIKYINLGPLGLHWAWPETRDHAKWGITTDSDWVCVGDINRMISQRQRGGGGIALQNPTLWQALSKTDLILAPPGHTREQALALIKRTHQDPDGAPGSAATPSRKPATPKKK